MKKLLLLAVLTLGAVVGLTTASAQQQGSNGTFKTIYHSDLPFFNQHNGPVLLFMDMQGCKPCRKWQMNLYQANIARWRSWGVRFYHYFEGTGLSDNNPLLNEYKLNNEIAKILINDMKVVQVPATLVFDGYGNCIYHHAGFSVEETEELTAELNSALQEALRRNGTFYTIYHSDLPFFNQHNGPVMLFMDMQYCKPCRKWQMNLYQANIERWRSWGVRFYHYIDGNSSSYDDPLPNEWKLNNEIAKMLKNDMKVLEFPATLVFDGYGNCIYRHAGFSVEKKEELTDELNSALREALRRNGK